MKSLKKKIIMTLLSVAIFASCIGIFMQFSTTVNASPQYTDEFIGYSGNLSDSEMFSASNTFNYSPSGSFFRYLYNMNSKNNNQVDSSTSITVFTHGLGGSASDFSNDGVKNDDDEQFAYDKVSAIDKLSAQAGGANKYWAICNGNSFRLIDLNVQSTSTIYNNNLNATTLQKHYAYSS